MYFDTNPFWGGGLMRGIKIPQQDCAKKAEGGGGVYLRDTTVLLFTEGHKTNLKVWCTGHTNNS